MKRVAIVHEWLAGTRGAERCLEVLCDMYPDADIFTLFHIKGSVSSAIESHRIHTSFLNSFPFIKHLYRYLLPLMPLAVESFKFDGYDVVISTSSCVAHGVVVPSGVQTVRGKSQGALADVSTQATATHIAYCYSPMRYIWDLSGRYFHQRGWLGELKYWFISALLHPIRVWDASAWLRPQKIAVVSQYIGKRLQKVCGRESEVIYPPVDVEFFSKGLQEKKQDYFLMVTAFEPSRQPIVAVQSCTKLGMPLKVVGSLGRHMRACRSVGGPTVEFLGRVSDEELMKLYGGALGLIVPGVEDFGMAPVEALAAGTPVIVNGEGGAREIVEGDAGNKSELGIVVSNLTIESLSNPIVEMKKGWENKRWDREMLSEYAQRFSRKQFVTSFRIFAGM